jgi:hypothetical protein
VNIGVVLTIALLVTAAVGGFVAGMIFGLGMAVQRIRHFRDHHVGQNMLEARTTLGALLPWLEGGEP